METEALKLPGQDVRKLLAAANGDAALLYLYEQSGLPRAEAMERLRMTQTQMCIRDSARYIWIRSVEYAPTGQNSPSAVSYTHLAAP